MAGNNQITTSIVVSFGLAGDGSGGAHLSAEIDGRDDGLNDGITNFIFGDSPVYLVYKTPNVTYTQRSTQGSLGGRGSTIVEVEDIVTFAEVREGSLSKPPAGGVNWTNLGGDSASFTVTGTSVVADRPIFAVYRATYNTVADAYAISGVSQVAGLPNISVLVLIKGVITP